MRIFVGLGLKPGQKARMAAAVGDDELVSAAGAGVEPDPAFLGCEVAFGNPPPGWVAASDALRWVQLESVGFDPYLELDWAALEGRLVMTNLAGFFADPVAETGLAGILALTRGIDLLGDLRRTRTWLGDGLRRELASLRDRTVVMFGRGAINARLADLLAPFGCRVRSFGRDWTPDALDEALRVADIVVSTVPDTPETRAVFDADRLALVPPHALFVNLGRGSVVDEAALADALRAGRLGGAVLDVTVDEPLPDGHPFWTTPNTIVTQHTGGGTGDEIDRKIDHFLANLDRYRRGAPLDGVIDIAKGY